MSLVFLARADIERWEMADDRFLSFREISKSFVHLMLIWEWLTFADHLQARSELAFVLVAVVSWVVAAPVVVQRALSVLDCSEDLVVDLTYPGHNHHYHHLLLLAELVADESSVLKHCILPAPSLSSQRLSLGLALSAALFLPL